MPWRNSTFGIALGIALAFAATGTVRATDSDEHQRVVAATTVLHEMMDAADQAIPLSVLEQAAAIAIFPSVKKAGFVVGGQWGRGIISARDPETGEWSSPAFLTLTGGSVGWQIGGEEIDLILVVTNRQGLEHMLSNEFKMGLEVSAAAGPVGRAAEASTDLHLRAQMLSYSRSRGLFAGATVNGSAIKEDLDANTRFYGSALTSQDIVLEHEGRSSVSSDALQAALVRYTQ